MAQGAAADSDAEAPAGGGVAGPAGLAIDTLVPTRKTAKGPGQPVRVSGFAVPAGTLTALVGPNGSGKSTLIEAALGLRPAYRVTATFQGAALADSPAGVRARLGAVLQTQDFAPGAAVGDVVALHRRLYGGDRAGLFELLRLGELKRQRFHRLSGGQKARVKLYYALAHDPELALLDEPEAALDAAYKQALASHLAERRAGRRVTVMASHDPWLIAQADRLAAFQAGNVVAHDALAQACAQVMGAYILELAFDSAEACARAAESLRASPELVRLAHGETTLAACGGADLTARVDALKAEPALRAHSVKRAEPGDLAHVLSWGA